MLHEHHPSCCNTYGARAPDIALVGPIAAPNGLGSLHMRQQPHVHHQGLASQAAHQNTAAAVVDAGLAELRTAVAQVLRGQAAHGAECWQCASGLAAGCCC